MERFYENNFMIPIQVQCVRFSVWSPDLIKSAPTLLTPYLLRSVFVGRNDSKSRMGVLLGWLQERSGFWKRL